MPSKSTDMQEVFNELSEQNKDIVILVAKGIKVAQETSEVSGELLKQSMQKEGVVCRK